MKLSPRLAFLTVLATGVSIIVTTTAYAQDDDTDIPNWIRNTALFWGQGDINDSEFVGLLQWLIDREIITVPSNNGDSELLVQELQNEISLLKSSIATDVRAAYEEGYADGQQDRKRDVHDDGDDNTQEMTVGEVQWLEANYPETGTGIVRIIDSDMNLNPESIDYFDIDVWSDSDAGGIDLTVTETNEATGIFEGTVLFTVTEESSGHRLRVAEGDTVTAEYEDNTLPDPYATVDKLDITATSIIGTSVPPAEGEHLTIQTNKATYNYADEVIFKGTLYGAPDRTSVSVMVTNNDSGQIVLITQVNLIRGEFESTFYLNGSLVESGSYTIEAAHGDLVATATFDVMVLTVFTDKSEYSHGDTIMFGGRAPDSVDVTYVIEDPDGNVLSVGQVPVEGRQYGDSIGPIVYLWNTGQYTVSVSYHDSYGDVVEAIQYFQYNTSGVVTIEPAYGSLTPGCEETVEGCYIPSVATVKGGSTVLFSNTDTAAHTFTSGNLDDGHDGFFDTGLLMTGSSFEWHPLAAGEYEYYCLVHPWMTGMIVVQ